MSSNIFYIENGAWSPKRTVNYCTGYLQRHLCMKTFTLHLMSCGVILGSNDKFRE